MSYEKRISSERFEDILSFLLENKNYLLDANFAKLDNFDLKLDLEELIHSPLVRPSSDQCLKSFRIIFKLSDDIYLRLAYLESYIYFLFISTSSYNGITLEEVISKLPIQFRKKFIFNLNLFI